MSLQNSLNSDSLSKLTSVSEVISKAEKFEANQMREAVIRAMLNSNTAVDDMNEEELTKFESDLIDSFRFKEWIK